MKKSQLIEGQIEEVIFPNRGRLTFEDEPVYIPGTFKDQIIKAQIIKRKKGNWEGRLLEVIKNPPHFISPVCPYFGSCGGCSSQEVPYVNQIELKHEQVRKLLHKAGIENYEDLGILPSPEKFHYRNKMEFSFGDAIKDGPMTLGMHRKHSSYDILTVDGCKLVEEDYSLILRTVLDYCISKGLPYYHKTSHQGFLRYLIIRQSKSFNEIIINLVTTTQMVHDWGELIEQLKALPLHNRLVGVLNTLSNTLADAVKPEKVILLEGKDTFMEKLLGLCFQVSPFSFFQTNTRGAEVLYKNALDLIDNLNDKIVFDLYCGTGTISQIMATKAQKVYGIELVEEAVEKAKENAALNDLTNCQFIAGDVLNQVDKLSAKPDIIVLDPPREGIHPKAIQKIIDFGAKELLYISCKPTSLTRDLPILKEAGYHVDKVLCVDMFPQTVHVETVVKLSR
ncbi:23S rRNA (uracil(1939)-C(5))-methyltransferase RlmD [Sporanaerobium hydrogeniformans]|uniref:23S rRNA (Uracil(1939)-C(5))-methyltransferase RlmD n=1 Tax=Sporanaerobium hydrogeniformans TaxID=3072179 RepID=A0AC61DBQ6_9FIRM|nr:23S rRNA (uracil(1939)-C(5))-methyltransferase RlmD [Sporanaerobium hydrogeniformans]PHV70684.1 23S rRNA (uracil(1939)-C(5))-methyltransferase RlmD [Sporanaerobium hydrogeniformans]